MKEMIEEKIAKYREQREQHKAEIEKLQAAIQERIKVIYALDGAIAALGDVLAKIDDSPTPAPG